MDGVVGCSEDGASDECGAVDFGSDAEVVADDEVPVAEDISGGRSSESGQDRDGREGVGETHGGSLSVYCKSLDIWGLLILSAVIFVYMDWEWKGKGMRVV